jgi:hypothetical protein
MTLPQETIDRIKTEASWYAYCADNRELHIAYEAGATAEAVQAQALVQALFWIDAYTQDELIKKYIAVKLASYRGEKEGEG